MESVDNFSLVLLYILLPYCHGFYVPGVSPTEYNQGDSIPIKAVKLWSPKTQMPYDYYHLPFCEPAEGKRIYESLNIGELIRGDRVVATAFKVTMLKNVGCQMACAKKELTAAQTDLFINMIENGYTAQINVDDLPVSVELAAGTQPQFELGYRLGIVSDNKVVVYNHLKFIIKYHEVNGRYRVVGIVVDPMSIQESDLIRNDDLTCERKTGRVPSPKLLENGKSTPITFTYEVEWLVSETEWTSRWDIYLYTGDGQIHWFSIINSIIIIFFLTAVMSIILLKTLRRDIALYNREEDSEEIIEESGWKLVHGDVFRPPRRSALLAAFVGSGVQLLCMTFIVLFFAMLGMLSPAARGALLSAVVFTYVFMGALAGYFAGRVYKTMRGLYWKSAALMTGSLYPGIILAVCIFINFFLWAKGSSAALPFTTILGMLSLWLLVSLPLVFVGFYVGVRKTPYEQPVRTNQIPRAIPERKMHQGLFVTTALCGLLPFGSVFIELFFIFNAIWNRQFYYLFGFLFIVFIILIISCAQVAIVATYMQLCSEDYHWWWRSFITSGGAALYLFAYSIYYFVTRLEITSFVSTLVYFGYCAMMTATFWILTGTIGFFGAFAFLQKIYAAIKID